MFSYKLGIDSIYNYCLNAFDIIVKLAKLMPLVFPELDLILNSQNNALITNYIPKFKSCVIFRKLSV